jgi:hypothetical protein
MLKESRVWFGAATLTHMKRIYIYSITEKKWKQMHGISRTGDQARRSARQSTNNPLTVTVVRLIQTG